MRDTWADDHGEQPMTRSQFEAEEARAELDPDAEPEQDVDHQGQALIAIAALAGKLSARRARIPARSEWTP
jgi:hypothetical protein